MVLIRAESHKYLSPPPPPVLLHCLLSFSASPPPRPGFNEAVASKLKRRMWEGGTSGCQVCIMLRFAWQKHTECNIKYFGYKKRGAVCDTVFASVCMYPSDLTNCTLPAPACIVRNCNVNSCLAPLSRREIKANKERIQKKSHCSSWWWEATLHDKKPPYCYSKSNIFHTKTI